MKRFLALLLMVSAGIASATDTTSAQYKTSNGSQVGATVIQQSLGDAKNASDIGPSNPLYVQGNVNATAVPAAAAVTDASATITTGGTFQQVLAANASRKTLHVQNICSVAGECTSTGDNCRVYEAAGTPTSHNSYVLAPNQDYLRSGGTVPSGAIKVTCDSTGDHIVVTEQ